MEPNATLMKKLRNSNTGAAAVTAFFLIVAGVFAPISGNSQTIGNLAQMPDADVSSSMGTKAVQPVYPTLTPERLEQHERLVLASRGGDSISKPQPLRAPVFVIPKAVPQRPGQTATDAEIEVLSGFHQRIVPFGRTSPEINHRFVRVLEKFQDRQDADDPQELEHYLNVEPESPWAPAVAFELGWFYRSRGFQTRAIQSLRRAWGITAKPETLDQQLLASAIAGAYAEMLAQNRLVGELQSIQKQLNKRALLGAANEQVLAARQSLSKPREKGLACGIMALTQIQQFRSPGARIPGILQDERERRRMAVQPVGDEMSLNQLHALAGAANLGLTPAKRTTAREVPTPAILHWKRGHFAAVVKRAGDRYLVRDPQTGGDHWISIKAIHEECSPYALLCIKVLPDGWVVPSQNELRKIKGKDTATPAPMPTDDPKACDPKTGGCGTCSGMPGHSIYLKQASIAVTDTPVGYKAAVGPPLEFTLRYTERQTNIDYYPTASSVGRLWTFDWISYVERNIVEEARVALRGGGVITYHDDPEEKSIEIEGGPTTTITVHHFNFDKPSHTRLEVIGTFDSPDGYKRVYRDGSMEFYEQPGPGNRFYLSKIVDALGRVVQLQYEPVGQQLRLSKIYDAAGMETTVKYENATFPLYVTGVTMLAGTPSERSTSLEYNDLGQLTAITDAVGLRSTFSYNANTDTLASVTTPYGETTFSSGYDGIGKYWAQVVDPEGGTERVETDYYAVPGLPSSDTAPAGMISAPFGLDACNTYHWTKKAMLEINDGPLDYSLAHISHWLLDVASYQLTTTVGCEKAPLEARVWYDYPGQANPGFIGEGFQPSKKGRILDSGESEIEKFTYDERGNLTSIEDPVYRKTVFEYDSAGHRVKVLQKRGNEYDELSETSYTESFTDSNLNGKWDVGEPFVDANGNGIYDLVSAAPCSYRDSAGRVSSYTYTPSGKIASVHKRVNGADLVTSYSYYAESDGHKNERLKSVSLGPPQQVLAEWDYDAAGNVIREMGSDGVRVDRVFDNLDRLLRIDYLDGTHEDLYYDKLDLISKSDRAGRVTAATYDRSRRLATISDPAGAVTTFENCACGALEAVVDANGNSTTYHYDLQMRLIKKIYADLSSEDYAYEPGSGRMSTVRNALGQVTRYEYFCDGQVKKISYEDANGVSLEEVRHPNTSAESRINAPVHFVYDPYYSRVANISDGTGTTMFDYVPAGNLGAGFLLSEDGPIPNASDKVLYGYDELSRQVTCQTGSDVRTREVDRFNRVVNESNALGRFEYSYDGTSNRVSTLICPNGMEIICEYFSADKGFHLKRIKSTKQSAPPSAAAYYSQFDYDYDPIGNIKTWEQKRAGAPSRRFVLQYDRINQLEKAQLFNTSNATLISEYRYLYDLVGNRISEQIGQGVKGATFNSLNQRVTSGGQGMMVFEGDVNEASTVTVAGRPAVVDSQNHWRSAAMVQSGENEIPIVAMDAQHNVTIKKARINVSGSQATSLSYDLNGSMKSRDDVGCVYSWDAESRLIKIAYSDGGSTEFTYNGRGQRIRATEFDRSGVKIDDTKFIWSGGEMLEERAWADNSIKKRYFTQGLARYDGVTQVLRYYIRDHIGSIREIVGEDGVSVGSLDYDPFGRIKLQVGEGSDMRFAGHYFHARSMLHLAFFRAYDSDNGIWLNRDPLDMAETREGPNLYSYVRNEPMRHFDPFGLNACTDAVGKMMGAVMAYGSTGAGTSAAGSWILMNGASAAMRRNPKLLDTSGFKDSLVSCQKGDIFKHLYGHVGTLLAGLNDWEEQEYQKDIDERDKALSDPKASMQKKCEKCEEVRDDDAARQAAQILKQLGNGTLNWRAAQRQLMNLLCK